jgi:polyferredoxin
VKVILVKILFEVGIFDVAVQVGNLLGNIFLLFVILNRPKRFFFLTIVFQSILMLGMLTGKLIPDSLTLHSFIMIMFLFGLTKAVWFLPNVLFAEYFDSERDKFWVGIWSTILWMGDPMTIFLYSLLTDTLKL